MDTTRFLLQRAAELLTERQPKATDTEALADDDFAVTQPAVFAAGIDVPLE